MKLGYDVLLEAAGQPPEQKPKDWGAIVTIAGDGVTQEEKERYINKCADAAEAEGWTDDAYHMRHVLIPQSRKEWLPPTKSTE